MTPVGLPTPFRGGAVRQGAEGILAVGGILAFVPLIVLGPAAGLVGGIWLGLLGEWGLLLYGLVMAVVMPMAFLLTFAVTAPLGFASSAAVDEGRRVAAAALGFLVGVWIGTVICGWAVLVFGLLVLMPGKGGSVPHLLWAWAIVNAPLTYMLRREREPAEASFEGVFLGQFVALVWGAGLMAGAGPQVLSSVLVVIVAVYGLVKAVQMNRLADIAAFARQLPPDGVTRLIFGDEGTRPEAENEAQREIRAQLRALGAHWTVGPWAARYIAELEEHDPEQKRQLEQEGILREMALLQQELAKRRVVDLTEEGTPARIAQELAVAEFISVPQPDQEETEEEAMEIANLFARWIQQVELERREDLTGDAADRPPS